MMIRNLFIGLLVVVLVGLVRPAGATAIVTPLLEKPVEISRYPKVQMISHGPQSAVTYRVTLEVNNPLTSGSLVLSAPKEALRMYADTESQAFMVNTVPRETGNIWLTFDGYHDKRFYLRRIKTAYIIPKGEETRQLRVRPEFVTRIEVAPGETVGIDLDFDLPMETVPRTIRLWLGQPDFAPGNSLEATVNMRFVGGPVVEKLKALQ